MGEHAGNVSAKNEEKRSTSAGAVVGHSRAVPPLAVIDAPPTGHGVAQKKKSLLVIILILNVQTVT